MQTHAHHSHSVAARFDRADEVDAVVRELHSLEDDEHLDVAVHRPDAHELDEAEHRLAISIGEGLLIGTVIGTLAGMGIMAIIGSRMADIDVPTLVAGGAAGGALLGLLFGAVVGMALRGEGIHEATWWESYHLSAGEGIVVAEVDDDGTGRRWARSVDPGVETASPLDREVMSVFMRHHGHIVPVP
ncbi:MAG: hypothetical protein HYX32_02320 [Actinobacteria bacterium]|nr:hypothetical protein [Actinomycetota bacterium]